MNQQFSPTALVRSIPKQHPALEWSSRLSLFYIEGYADKVALHLWTEKIHIKYRKINWFAQQLFCMHVTNGPVPRDSIVGA